MVSEPTNGRIMVLIESNKEDIGCIDLMENDLDTPDAILVDLALVRSKLEEVRALYDKVLRD